MINKKKIALLVLTVLVGTTLLTSCASGRMKCPTYTKQPVEINQNSDCNS